MPIVVVINQYADYFSAWYGLKDGTMLDTGDRRGGFWVKTPEGTVSAQEWNRGLEEEQ